MISFVFKLGHSLTLLIGTISVLTMANEYKPSEVMQTYMGGQYQGTKKDGYTLLQVYTRSDHSAFTQGLTYDLERRQLVESTGWYGESRNQYLDIDEDTATIKPVMVEPIPDKLFGEGITILNDKELIQLTWQENVVNILDRESLRVKRTIPMWQGVRQGWGITLNPFTNELYVSDGTFRIIKVDASTLEKTGELLIRTEKSQLLDQINELEFVNGFIWANLWQHSWIAKIDPTTGQVIRMIDMTKLTNAEMKLVEDRNEHKGYDRQNNVLNGIAYDVENDEFYMTGKRWHLMFKLRIHD